MTRSEESKASHFAAEQAHHQTKYYDLLSKLENGGWRYASIAHPQERRLSFRSLLPIDLCSVDYNDALEKLSLRDDEGEIINGLTINTDPEHIYIQYMGLLDEKFVALIGIMTQVIS
jgi:hypothetical protein